MLGQKDCMFFFSSIAGTSINCTSNIFNHSTFLIKDNNAWENILFVSAYLPAYPIFTLQYFTFSSRLVSTVLKSIN